MEKLKSYFPIILVILILGGGGWFIFNNVTHVQKSDELKEAEKGSSYNDSVTSEMYDDTEENVNKDNQSPELNDNMTISQFFDTPGLRIWFFGETSGNLADNPIGLYSNTNITGIGIQRDNNVYVYKVQGEDLEFSDLKDLTDQEIATKVQSNSLYSNISFIKAEETYRWEVITEGTNSQINLKEYDPNMKPGTEENMLSIDFDPTKNGTVARSSQYIPNAESFYTLEGSLTYGSLTKDMDYTGIILSGLYKSIEADDGEWEITYVATITDSYYSINLNN